MGILGRALGEGLNLGAAELVKDYERQGDVAAKKDLASFEGQIRSDLQDRQNEFTGRQSELGRAHEAGLQKARLDSEEGRAKATNELGYYQADITLGRNIADQDYQNQMVKIHGTQLGQALANFKLETDKFEFYKTHSDLPESTKVETGSLQKQADEYFKTARDQMATPEERQQALSKGNAALDMIREKLAPFAKQKQAADTDEPKAPRLGGRDFQPSYNFPAPKTDTGTGMLPSASSSSTGPPSSMADQVARANQKYVATSYSSMGFPELKRAMLSGDEGARQEFLRRTGTMGNLLPQ